MSTETVNDFVEKVWDTIEAEDYVERVLRENGTFELHTPERPYAPRFYQRRMTAILDEEELVRMRPVLLQRIRARREWEDHDDDEAVIEELRAKLEEGVLSAYLGVVLLEFHNGYFRPHASNPPRPPRRPYAEGP